MKRRSNVQRSARTRPRRNGAPRRATWKGSRQTRSQRARCARETSRTPRASPTTTPLLAADGHEDRLDRVVRVAAEVPGRLERLLVSGLVPRPGAEDVLARLCLPREAPAAPRPALAGGLELGLGPRRAAVAADLDRVDGR